ncbi:MAG: hypothetical protein ACD_58C00122G0003 [uncultured bacterium]|nr:MAG: hypothetical protein ACD_58C00122G0003 [uncultured bacterium]
MGLKQKESLISDISEIRLVEINTIMNHTVPIEVSARHIHLSQNDLDILFGKGYKLTEFKKISQPGQFASREVVKIVGHKSQFDNVRIIGPIRKQTQLEISATDAYQLGIEPQVRISGDLNGTNGDVKVVGLHGKIDLTSGVIIAQRHLHIEPEKMSEFGLKHDQLISIKTDGIRSVVFNNVAVRSRYGEDVLFFQLDVDEANAAGIKNGGEGEIVV